MLGAITGDIIGSVHEHTETKTKDFPLFTPRSRFTDDTVLTVAVADALLGEREYVDSVIQILGSAGKPRAVQQLRQWCGDAGQSRSVCTRETLPEVLAEAERSAAVTHNHPEGIKGATVPEAVVVFLDETDFENAIRFTAAFRPASEPARPRFSMLP